MFPLQVQKALEAPTDPGGAEQTKCEIDSCPLGWREQESDSSHEARNGEDEFSALLGVEHLYSESGPDEADCEVQGGVTNTHCREQEIQHINTRNTEEQQLNNHHINLELTEVTQERLSLSINVLGAAELSTQLDQGTGKLNAQHVNTFNSNHTSANNTEELNTQDLTGRVCVETKSEERAGSQSAEKRDENIAEEKRKDDVEPHDRRHVSFAQHCGETCLKVSTCSQRRHLFSLNDSDKHNLESTSICSAEIHTNTHSNINTHLDRLHRADDKHTCKPELHSSDISGVGIRDTGVQSCCQNSDLHHKNSSHLDAHCLETFIDTEGTKCFRQRHNIKSGCVNITHKAPPSQGDACHGKTLLYKADELDSLSRSEPKQINCSEYSLHSHATKESTNTSGVKAKALNTDALIVFTTCGDCNKAEKTEEYCSAHFNTCDGDTKPPDTLCVSGIHSLHLGTESVNSPGSGFRHPVNGKLLPACPEETAVETLLHTGAETQLQKLPHDQLQDFLPCPTDCEDVDKTVWLNSQVPAAENNKSKLPCTRGVKQFMTREDRKNRFEEKVWEESSFPLTLFPLSTSVESLAEGITLLQIHNECKDINSHSQELLISSSHSCDRSRYSLSSEEKVKDQSQELTRSEEVEDSQYPKHGPSIEDELHPPLHSAKSNHFEVRKENCVPSKPVETPLFTVCQPTHTHEQCVNALNNHTLFIDLKHKRSISSPQGNVIEIPFPDTSTIETLEDSKATFVEKNNPQSDQIEPCWNLTVYNNTASEKSAEAKEAVGVCNPWLEPFSDGPESDSEDSDQTSSLVQTFNQNKGAVQKGLVNSDVLFPVDWSSEDSAVSGLGEDLENIHCDFYPPQVENLEQFTQKVYIEKDICLHSECKIVSTDNKLHNNQKFHIDSNLTQPFPNGHNPFTHSGKCKDINHTHIHTTLCGCIQETDFDSFSSQPHQPCIDVLKSSPGYLNLLKQDKQKELSSSTCLRSNNSSRSCGEKEDSSFALSEVQTIHYAQSEVLLSSRSLEPIPETDCSLDNFSNPDDDTFLGDRKTETEKFESEKMKPSESNQDLLGVTSYVHHLSICKGNFSQKTWKKK